MNPVILFLIFFLFHSSTYSQQSSKSTYLIVRIESQVEKKQNRLFYRINAERNNPYAQEVFNLVTYNIEKNAVNEGAAIYSQMNDTATSYYNFFPNPTGALLFLSERGWQLITVNNEIRSGSQTVRAVSEYYPVTTIYSQPVYYLKKEVE